MELLIENALNIGSDEFYRALRYKLSLVVLLINSDDKNAFNILEDSVRQSDILQQLDSDTIIVFLSHTNIQESNLFIEKIRNRFNFTYTIAEFKDSEFKFLKTLFLQNDKHIKKILV